MLHTLGGWRLSRAYDIVPVPLLPQARSNSALEVRKFGCAASRFNLFSLCEVFGLASEEVENLLDAMQRVVAGRKELFAANGVKSRSPEMLEQAILPGSFEQNTPAEAI